MTGTPRGIDGGYRKDRIWVIEQLTSVDLASGSRGRWTGRSPRRSASACSGIPQVRPHDPACRRRRPRDDARSRGVAEHAWCARARGGREKSVLAGNMRSGSDGTRTRDLRRDRLRDRPLGRTTTDDGRRRNAAHCRGLASPSLLAAGSRSRASCRRSGILVASGQTETSGCRPTEQAAPARIQLAPALPRDKAEAINRPRQVAASVVSDRLTVAVTRCRPRGSRIR
jgi:hypothetical protein